MKTLPLIRSSLLALVVATAAGLTRADVVVDTGTPAGNSGWLLGDAVGYPYQQSLGAKFTLSDATTIASIEGYSYASADNWLDISIAADGGTVPGANLFTASVFMTGSSVFDWHGVFGLNWALAAGDYWVTFVGQTGFKGGMAGDAPNDQAIEAFAFPGDGVWYSANNLNLGVRINSESAGNNVPDSGATVALIGAALVGLAAVRRRLA